VIFCIPDDDLLKMLTEKNKMVVGSRSFLTMAASGRTS